MNQIFIPDITPGERGFMAGLSGCDPRECPFDKMTSEWNEWQRWHSYGIQLADLLEKEQAEPGPLPKPKLYLAGWIAILIVAIAIVGLSIP